MGRSKKPRSPLARKAQPGGGAKDSKKKTKKSKPSSASSRGPERLQKLLARAGHGSRRACEELIREGRVTIDGEAAVEVGVKADPVAQDVRVDGVLLRREEPVYYLLNKPKHILCTTSDPEGRQTVLDLIPHEKRRIFSVGRLDSESRGAVILTNDGSFTNLLTHPRYGIEKTYSIRVRGLVEDGAVERLRAGVWLSEGKTLPARVWVVKRRREETELGLTLCEGKNRQVRRMLSKVGYKVLSLKRTRVGPLTLHSLAEGAYRLLKPKEVDSLRRLAQENAKQPNPSGPGRRGSRRKSLGKPDPASPQPRSGP